MKTVEQFQQDRELAQLYPVLCELEAKLKAEGIDPEEYMLNEFLGSMAAGALGAGGLMLGKHLWNKAGGLQGVKGMAQAGWDGLKRTAGDMKAAHGANMIFQNRANAKKAVALAGGTATLPELDPADPAKVTAWADGIKKSVDRVATIKNTLMSNDPQIKHLAAQISAAADAMRSRASQLPVATP